MTMLNDNAITSDCLWLGLWSNNLDIQVWFEKLIQYEQTNKNIILSVFLSNKNVEMWTGSDVMSPPGETMNYEINKVKII